jgi:hypothetical protein
LPNVDDLYYFDRGGHVLRRASVVRTNRDPIMNRPGLHSWLIALWMPSLVAAIVEPAIGENWTLLALLCVGSGILAWLAAKRQRAYSQRGAVGWAIFVFLSGVPGFAAYLVHRRWPVRVACPSCGRFAPRDRESCALCGKEFPRPALKGIEVVAA